MLINQHRLIVSVASAFLVVILGGCSSQFQPVPPTPTLTSTKSALIPTPSIIGVNAPVELVAAQEALERFLNALAEGNYAAAVTLYAGDYETLHDYNPSIARNDYAALFEAACEVNGYKCLKPNAITLTDDNYDRKTFAVSFINSDGSIFVFIPPFSNPNERRDVFLFTVITNAEGPKVLDLPPYIS